MNPGLTVRMPSPALFTSMSMPPSRDHASSTARATDDSSRTSSSTPTAPGNSAATEPARRPDRPVSATDAPAAARAEAIANPSPLVPPVTNTLTGIPPGPTNGPPAAVPRQRRNTNDHDARSSCVLEVKPRQASGVCSTMSGVERGMVIIPGGSLGPHEPLLNYSWLAGRVRHAEVVHVHWPAERPSSTNPADSAAWVVEHVASVLAAFVVRQPVLVGKSLGTYAVALAAEHDLPGIWHTPLLSDRRCVAALRRASAPFLLIGGTADPWWDGELARALTPHVVEVAGANHGMILVDEPLARSAAVLGQVLTVVEKFLDEQAWPT